MSKSKDRENVIKGTEQGARQGTDQGARQGTLTLPTWLKVLEATPLSNSGFFIVF